MRVAFLTLGCKVNFYETEKMMEQFKERGFSVVEFSEAADIYIVNTCTVTNIADRKSRQMLHRARKKNPAAKVVAVGCYAESGEEALREDKTVDAVYSNRDKETVAEKVIERFELGERLRESGGSFGAEPKSEKTDEGSVPDQRTRAFVKVQDGCNQFCAYCLIPYVRGGGILRSTPVDAVAEQVGILAGKGFQEVVLTGIHLSSYGVDFAGEKNFVKLGGEPLLALIRRVAETEGIERIRLGSLEPRIITEEFLKGLAEIPKLCPHFHLSLQSGCDTVLRRMNRRYTAGEYGEKVEMLRKYFDMPAVTTDVIVGFPGETEEEFQETVCFLDCQRLADVHVFPYSLRSGTKAAEMENHVSPEVKNERSAILLKKVEGYKADYGKFFIGRVEKVLFEETRKQNGREYLVGHNERYVRIGVELEEARKRGYVENGIFSVKVENVL